MMPDRMRMIEFGKDFHPEFEGYVWEKDDGIWISTISSKEPGKGHFLKLLAELKSKYAFIKIPTPSDRMLMIALRNGFSMTTEWNEKVEEDMDVLLWKKS